jgi:hypothetical protein
MNAMLPIAAVTLAVGELLVFALFLPDAAAEVAGHAEVEWPGR